MTKRFIAMGLIIVSSMIYAASPFFESSVYIVSNRANIRQEPSLDSPILMEAEKYDAFKYIESVTVDETKWYKIEIYDAKDYEVWYKKRSKDVIHNNNFQQMLTLYKNMDETGETIEIIPTKRNTAYDHQQAKDYSWVRVRLFKAKTAYVAASLAEWINRPYFFVDLAFAAFKRYPKWSYKTRKNVLDGKIAYNMTPSMVKAIKGEPDSIVQDKKAGRNAYFTYWYGSQGINFKHYRVTSW